MELDGNFKEPFRGSRVFEIFLLKELQASVDSSFDSHRGQQPGKLQGSSRDPVDIQLIKTPSKPEF